MSSNRGSRSIPKLYCIHHRQCDPKKCTALKLKKANLINFITEKKGVVHHAIVLNPFSLREISIDDRELVKKHGIVVIDCSWNELSSINLKHFKQERKLPPLLATNPTNYGKWEKLSSVEALAAALYITRYNDLAEELLSKFSWGKQFKILNNFE
ncbi:MAG: DUF367 family protein [Promethearchaeota archaeon]